MVHVARNHKRLHNKTMVVQVKIGNKERVLVDGDTEPETLFMHANDHRRWRIAQTIERSALTYVLGLIYMNF